MYMYIYLLFYTFIVRKKYLNFFHTVFKEVTRGLSGNLQSNLLFVYRSDLGNLNIFSQLGNLTYYCRFKLI